MLEGVVVTKTLSLCSDLALSGTGLACEPNVCPKVGFELVASCAFQALLCRRPVPNDASVDIDS